MRNVLKITLFAAITALAFFGVPTPASATIVQVTYTGTISSGYDYTGVFGAPNTNLSGDLYTTRYLFDTTLGSTLSSPTSNYAIGGTVSPLPPPVPVTPVSPLPSPSLGAVVTINGKALAIGGSYLGIVLGQNNGPAALSEADDYTQDFFQNTSTFNDQLVQNYITNVLGTIPSSIASSYTYSVGRGDNAGGSIHDATYSYILGQYSADAYAQLEPSTLTYSVISDVPEPATLLLLGTGLFGLGLMRRRRAATLLAAALVLACATSANATAITSGLFEDTVGNLHTTNPNENLFVVGHETELPTPFMWTENYAQLTMPDLETWLGWQLSQVQAGQAIPNGEVNVVGQVSTSSWAAATTSRTATLRHIPEPTSFLLTRSPSRLCSLIAASMTEATATNVPSFMRCTTLLLRQPPHQSQSRRRLC